LILGAGDISIGGLAILLFRMSYNTWNRKKIAFELDSETMIKLKEQWKRWDLIFFGESSASIVVSIEPSQKKLFLDALSNFQLPYNYLGKTTKKDYLDFYAFKGDIAASIEFFESGIVSVFKK
jgi:phosphoribosylformylglycinamidine (FGAM) synthase-like enzyme